ncbi:MAG: hypothetical protein ABI232_05375 [Jatrophihabitantaceae bacterium]
MDPSDEIEPYRIELHKPDGGADGFDVGSAADVGEFRQGSPLSQWALARYLVGRAIGESISTSLMITAVVILTVAGLFWWLGWIGWAILVAIIALLMLGMRAILLAVLRRLTAAGAYTPIEQRMRAIVADTRSDVLAELRRIGLPGRTWTLPLLALRFAGRERRALTLKRLREFQVQNAVPKARLDELHLLLLTAVGRAAPTEP